MTPATAAVGNRNTAQRIINAAEAFKDTVIEVLAANQVEIDRKTAAKVLLVYVKVKFVKLDAVSGRYTVKHGSYWDFHTLLAALAYEEN